VVAGESGEVGNPGTLPRQAGAGGMTKERVTVSHKVVAGPRPSQCLSSADNFHGTVALSFVIPSEAEGSAVLRIFPGNVFSINSGRECRSEAPVF
jgi:hypothetical protein